MLQEPKSDDQRKEDPAPKPEERLLLDDRELLQQFDPANIASDPKNRGAVIDQGKTISCPSERHREYRGLLRIARAQRTAGYNFEGVTQWGPAGRVGSQEKVVYRGDDPEEAARAVNTMINKKLAKKYQVVNPGDQPLVDADQGRARAQTMVKQP